MSNTCEFSHIEASFNPDPNPVLSANISAMENVRLRNQLAEERTELWRAKLEVAELREQLVAAGRLEYQRMGVKQLSTERASWTSHPRSA